MHLISELSDRLEASAKTGCEEKMISKKDIANLESILLLPMEKGAFLWN